MPEPLRRMLRERYEPNRRRLEPHRSSSPLGRPIFAAGSSLHARRTLAFAVATASIAKPPNSGLLRTKDRLQNFEFSPYAGPRSSVIKENRIAGPRPR